MFMLLHVFISSIECLPFFWEEYESDKFGKFTAPKEKTQTIFITKAMKDCFSIMWSYMYVWLHIVTHPSRFFIPFLVTSETDTQTHKYIEMQTLNVCVGSISVISSEIRTPSSISSRFCDVQYAPFTFGVGMDLLPWGMGLNPTEYLKLFSWVAVIMGKDSVYKIR